MYSLCRRSADHYVLELPPVISRIVLRTIRDGSLSACLHCLQLLTLNYVRTNRIKQRRPVFPYLHYVYLSVGVILTNIVFFHEIFLASYLEAQAGVTCDAPLLAVCSRFGPLLSTTTTIISNFKDTRLVRV